MPEWLKEGTPVKVRLQPKAGELMPGWLRVKGGAKYADCSERLFRDWLKQGLRHVRINGTIRTKPEWIDEFLMKGEIHQDQVSDIVNDTLKGLI